MSETNVRWLLDVNLPRVNPNWHSMDMIHAENLERRPGPAGITEAFHLGRVLVTRDQSFRGSWYIPVAHSGIVILDGNPVSGEEVLRNLTHLLFCLYRNWQEGDMPGRRYVIKADHAILRILPDGSEQDVESWKQPRIAVSQMVS